MSDNKKPRRACKKWTKDEENELKKLCRESRSWRELKSKVEKSQLLKERKYRDQIRRKARHLGLTNHFTDRRRTISRKEEIREKQFLFPESEKIVPEETFEITGEAWKKPDTEVGAISRIDYGSEGYRVGLWRLALKVAAKQGFRFNILLGGLVHKKSLVEELKKRLEALKEQQRGLKLSVEKKRKEKEQVIEDFYMECAKDLAKLIPQIKKPSGGLVKLYIVTSLPFDGKIGDEIANRLTAIRKGGDIVYWGFNPEFPLLVKYVNKTLFPLVSQKQSFMRSKYYSTPVQRELEDILKRSSELSNIYGVGCYASSIFKPQGESRRAYFSTPALHKLSETRTSENQIGMRTINFLNNGEFSVKNYSFKDLIRKERKLITIPSNCSQLQKAIIEELTVAKASSGILEYKLKERGSRWKNVTREKIVKAIENLKRFRPSIEFNDASKCYDFDPRWFQRKAIYELPAEEELAEDRFTAFACPHIGAPQTNYRFIIEEIPRYILVSNSQYLVLAGDVIQGTHHYLIEKGQVYRGLNYTYQEQLAAGLTGIVITKVFESRFKKAIHNKEGLTQPELRKIVSDSLVTFLYLEGNHDAWERDKSFIPLVVFKQELINIVVREVKRVLKECNVRVNGIHSIVVSKIIQDDPVEQVFYRTPSGLAVKVGHPFTGRNITASISGERFMQMHLESHVNFVGNWHVGLSMEHFDQEIGQRVYVQLPTIQRYTLFESNKMKKTDFGIAICKVKSYKGRIIVSETGFYGDRFYGDKKKNLKKIDNDVIDEMLVKVGVPLR